MTTYQCGHGKLPHSKIRCFLYNFRTRRGPKICTQCMQALDGPDLPRVTFTNKIPDSAVAIGLGANANPILAAPPSPEAFPKDVSSIVDQFIEDKLGRASYANQVVLARFCKILVKCMTMADATPGQIQDVLDIRSRHRIKAAGSSMGGVLTYLDVTIS